jgi:hypothetical protein
MYEANLCRVAYLPNRGWNKDEDRWMYLPASQHERDVQMVQAWAARRKVVVVPEQMRAGNGD